MTKTNMKLVCHRQTQQIASIANIYKFSMSCPSFQKDEETLTKRREVMKVSAVSANGCLLKPKRDKRPTFPTIYKQRPLNIQSAEWNKGGKRLGRI